MTRRFFLAALALAFACSSVYAGEIQTKSTLSGTSMTFDMNVTAHSTLLFATRISDPVITVTGVSDTVNGAWTGPAVKRIVQSTDTHGSEVWIFPDSAAGAMTITATLSSAITARSAIGEYAMGSSGGAVDQSSSNQQDGTTAPTSGSVTTTTATETIIGWGSAGGGPTWTAGSGYTVREQPSGKGALEDKNVSATGSYAADFSLSGSDNVTVIIVTLKSAGGAGPAKAVFTHHMMQQTISRRDITHPWRRASYYGEASWQRARWRRRAHHHLRTPLTRQTVR